MTGVQTCALPILEKKISSIEKLVYSLPLYHASTLIKSHGKGLAEVAQEMWESEIESFPLGPLVSFILDNIQNSYLKKINYSGILKYIKRFLLAIQLPASAIEVGSFFSDFQTKDGAVDFLVSTGGWGIEKLEPSLVSPTQRSYSFSATGWGLHRAVLGGLGMNFLAKDGVGKPTPEGQIGRAHV